MCCWLMVRCLDRRCDRDLVPIEGPQGKQMVLSVLRIRWSLQFYGRGKFHSIVALLEGLYRRARATAVCVYNMLYV